MAANHQPVIDRVRAFVLREFLPGEDASELKNDTPLMTSGILDSIATLKMVTFLESEFDISVEAHEVDAENLNTLALIGALVASKKNT
jgi:acyl carrier protein